MAHTRFEKKSDGKLPSMQRVKCLFQLSDAANKAFVNIATAVTSMVEDLVDTYWVTTRFYTVYRKHAEILHKLVSHRFR